jgi:hypothetical protein
MGSRFREFMEMHHAGKLGEGERKKLRKEVDEKIRKDRLKNFVTKDGVKIDLSTIKPDLEAKKVVFHEKQTIFKGKGF